MGTALQTQPISNDFFSPLSETIVTWVGMAGALINARGTILLIDPLLTLIERNHEWLNESGHRMKIKLPIAADGIPRVDIVCYTHAENDHYADPSARILNERLAPVFIAPPPVLERLRALGVDSARLYCARDFESYRAGSSEILFTPCLHDHPYNDRPKPWKRGECMGYLVKTPDGAIWHPGDTRLIDELLTVRGVDILFFDVAAVESHLGPAGSAQLAVSSGASLMLAYHYGTFDLPPGTWGSCEPQDCIPFTEGLAARFITPNPGEQLRLSTGKCVSARSC